MMPSRRPSFDPNHASTCGIVWKMPAPSSAALCATSVARPCCRGVETSHAVRICDDAAESLDQVLQGRFGVKRHGSVDYERIEEALRAIRAEARARGLVK